MKGLFLNKRKYVGIDENEYINLCIPCIKTKDITTNAIIRVVDDEDGRIDKFVNRTMGATNENMIDILMYANHIFNPFSIKSGDVLYIPADGSDNLISESTLEPRLPDGTTHSNNSRAKKEMTYAERVEYLALMGLGRC